MPVTIITPEQNDAVETPAPPKRGFLGGREGAQKKFVAGVMSPAIAYMLLWGILPIFWAFALGFFMYSARRSGGPFLGLGGDNPFVGLDHFKAMLDFSDEAPLNVQQFHIAIKVTLLFAFIVVPLNLSISLPLAAMIESVHNKAKPLFRSIFFIPVLTSAVGVAVIWGFVLHPQRGLLNALLSKITGHLVVISWTTDPDLVVIGIPVALLAIIVAYIWQDIGYNLVIFIAALQAIPQSVKDAALIDGASAWQTFRYITLPLLKPTILLASVLTMISAFQVFDLFQVMTAGGPQDQTRALSLDIYQNAFRFQRMGWAAAVSLVLFAIVLVISLIQTRMLKANWEY
ncbi:MAG: sugar ABC transporter permease [Lentisphaeria bacterium]|nr:sugar ABC transporter permease [Lentisphaeria bacterium]